MARSSLGKFIIRLLNEPENWNQWIGIMITHKGYIGFFSFDEKTNLFRGKVSNIQYPITFQGKSIKEMKQTFRDSIDEYLAWCKKYGKTPEKPSSLE